MIAEQRYSLSLSLSVSLSLSLCLSLSLSLSHRIAAMRLAPARTILHSDRTRYERARPGEGKIPMSGRSRGRPRLAGKLSLALDISAT